jgi:hypothetical protein
MASEPPLLQGKIMSIQRILMLMPESPALVESAKLATSREGPRIARSEIGLHSAIHLDESFAATPIEIPREQARDLNLAVEPSRPVGYVLRGIVETGELPAVQASASDFGYEIHVDPEIGLLPTCTGDPPVFTDADVRRLLGVSALHARGFDGSNVALAIIDNGISLPSLQELGLAPTLDPQLSWSPLRAVMPGAALREHGTMCAYDALLAAPNATLLDHSALLPTRLGTMEMDGILSDAMKAFGILLTMMLLPDEERPFRSLVVSNSWALLHPSYDFPPGHRGRYGDNPRHPFFTQVTNLVAAGADVLFAAGNCGPQCPDDRCLATIENTIAGANSHPDVLTVAGVDDTDTAAGFSARGPGILFPEKPDLAAYTHFLGSMVFGAGADSGTSAACAVLAGVVAAVRSAVPFVRARANRSPAALKEFLLANARRPDGQVATWTADIGFGLPANLLQATASLA